jgi:uncharacterized membrane protein YccC
MKKILISLGIFVWLPAVAWIFGWLAGRRRRRSRQPRVAEDHLRRLREAIERVLADDAP